MAPPNPRVVKAFHAMRDIGIPDVKVKPVLKELLKVYGKNWDLIEGENYRVLVDAIFYFDEGYEAQDAASTSKIEHVEEQTLKEKEVLQKETEPPMKRMRLKYPQGLDVDQDSTFSTGGSLRIPRDKPIDDGPDYIPPAVMDPETPNEGYGERSPQKGLPIEDVERSVQKAYGAEFIRNAETSQLHVASTPLGEVKISLSCDKTGFRMPSLDAVVKMVEDRCLRSYKILDPNFSVKKLMEDKCECFLELGSETTQEKKEFVQVTPKIDALRNRSCGIPSPGRAIPFDNPGFPYKAQSDTEVALPETLPPQPDKEFSVCSGVAHGADDQNGIGTPTCMSLVVAQQNEITSDQIQALHDISDISKGLESVAIPLERGNQECLPSFCYIRNNVIFQKAAVDFTLAVIGDNCCSTCPGDCLMSDLACVCAIETGCEFAYTAEGLMKEGLLDEFISLKCNPQSRSLYFCMECPLERSKNGAVMKPCKGHLSRKFIKECWLKCGCLKNCGNRVVQRGITCKLQVFESEGKGWGLRTLEDLPKGAFVCEYAGEVLTHAELSIRALKNPNGEGQSFPVLLDADWASYEEGLKDEEALFIDGAQFGNVARFINHRCSDANLVDIPIEIENPAHHYYHIAFFTTREVKAMEELTWDYGINFDDSEHSFKAFQCQPVLLEHQRHE